VYNEFSNQENTINHIGFTFERNDSIFIWDEDEFLLRYDFSAALGDTITISSTNLEITEGGSTDSFKVVLDSIKTENIGISQTAVQKYYTHPVDGTLDYFDGGYYRTIGSQSIWGGLTSNLIAVGHIFYDLRCYVDDEIEILGISITCDFSTANNELIEQALVQIYPNPVQDYLNIYLENNAAENWSFTLNNILGQEVGRYTIKTDTTNFPFKIAVNHLQPGQYFLTIQNRKGQFLKAYSWVKQ